MPRGRRGSARPGERHHRHKAAARDAEHADDLARARRQRAERPVDPRGDLERQALRPAIAFESEATNLVRNDTNGVKDVFVVLRTGHIDNFGAVWKPGRTVLISRGRGGQPANGASSSPSISGGFHWRPTCVGFLSAASNLVSGDNNGTFDAFTARVHGGGVRRVKLPRGVVGDTTAVAVSGDCKQVAYVKGGRLWVSKRNHKPQPRGPGRRGRPLVLDRSQERPRVRRAPRRVPLARWHAARPAHRPWRPQPGLQRHQAPGCDVREGQPGRRTRTSASASGSSAPARATPATARRATR